MTGIVFGEQPRRHDGRLWFSDWGTQEVIPVDLDGTAEVMHRGSSFPLCVDWLPDGRLLVVATSTARLLVQKADRSLGMYADLRQGSEDGRG
jgi:sugar lactone lactonase YvrE